MESLVLCWGGCSESWSGADHLRFRVSQFFVLGESETLQPETKYQQQLQRVGKNFQKL
jgi:hypothetical protein